MSIHWEENLRVGVPAIDEQHEGIFAHFDKLSEAMQEGKGSEGIGELLNYLNEYAATHFSDEENLMILYKYHGLEEQRQQHAQFKENIKVLSDMLATNTPAKEVGVKIDAMLIRYFINHVRALDSKLGEFIKSKKQT